MKPRIMLHNAVIGPFDSPEEAQAHKEQLFGNPANPDGIYSDVNRFSNLFYGENEVVKYYYLAHPYFKPKVVNQWEKIMTGGYEVPVVTRKYHLTKDEDNGEEELLNILNEPKLKTYYIPEGYAVYDSDGNICQNTSVQDSNWRTCRQCWQRKFGWDVTEVDVVGDSIRYTRVDMI